MNHEEEFNVEGYEHTFKNEPLFQDLDYQDQDPPPHHAGGQPAYEETYEEEEEDEELAEPTAASGGGGKKGPSRGMLIALGGVGAIVLALGGTYAMAPEVFEELPNTVMATLTGEEPAEDAAEPAPEPSVAKPHHKPKPKPKEPVTAAKPKPKPKPHAVAAKPEEAPPPPAQNMDADNPEFKQDPPPKPKPKPAKPKPHVAAKPKPKEPVAVAKPKPVAAAGKPASFQAQTAVSFAPGSYWVAATEIEHLWSFSSRVKSDNGQFMVESWVGSERDGVNLSRKRANRVAELLTKNNAPRSYKVTVKVHGNGPSKAGTGKVNVTFSSAEKL